MWSLMPDCGDTASKLRLSFDAAGCDAMPIERTLTAVDDDDEGVLCLK